MHTFKLTVLAILAAASTFGCTSQVSTDVATHPQFIADLSLSKSDHTCDFTMDVEERGGKAVRGPSDLKTFEASLVAGRSKRQLSCAYTFMGAMALTPEEALKDERVRDATQRLSVAPSEYFMIQGYRRSRMNEFQWIIYRNPLDQSYRAIILRDDTDVKGARLALYRANETPFVVVQVNR
jgi:hypothetical protein